MRTPHDTRALSNIAQTTCTVLLLGSMFLLSACGGDPALQHRAQTNQAQLDSLLTHAQTIGIAHSDLQPIIQKTQQLEQTHAPIALFDASANSKYYRNLSTQYQQLATRVHNIITHTTQQTQMQAQSAMQQFQMTLTKRSAQHLPTHAFTQQLIQEQKQFKAAKYPKDYTAISSRTRDATRALNMLPEASARMDTFKQTLDQMSSNNLDTSWLQDQYLADEQVLKQSTTAADMQRLNGMIDTQYMQAVVRSVQALPYILEAKLKDFATRIKLLQSYGGNAATYQKQLSANQAQLQQHPNTQGYMALAQTIKKENGQLGFGILKSEAHTLIKRFHSAVASWGKVHMYHDTYNGQDYSLDTGYGDLGIGSDLDGYLASAVTPQDFQQVVTLADNDMFNLQLFEADYRDKTPYSQVHRTDIQALHHYNLMHGQVIVISLAQQALRAYQDGKLVRGFLVTTGQAALPSLPGVWPIEARESPTVFKSLEPKSSPYWYPDTPIHYAMLYHEGGYFIHDSWWRADYGPGTQFPHNDSGGDESFAGTGSHGCVNVPLDQAAWLYANTNWQTQVVIY